MKTLWILAAAATFAACHNRPEDETGAAPDRGDTTSTSGYDTTTTQPSPSTTGYDTTTQTPTDTSMAPSGGYDTTTTNPPSAGYDTTTTNPPSAGYDTTSTNPPSAGYDTTSTTNPAAGATTDTTMGAGADSVRVNSNSGSMQGDSAATNTNIPDSSSTQR